MALLAAGLGVTGAAKELFSYNRENYKWDKEQKLERETWRYEMQLKRFELYREDVRDLVALTVDRMDVYHLVGSMFLSFSVFLFVEGRVKNAPPFVLFLFLFSNASAFVYLLLAVWLSMHASIAAHSVGVRLLTRFVRLPIPSDKQLQNLTWQLKTFEQQGAANLLRLPFLDRKSDTYTDAGGADASGTLAKSEGAQSGSVTLRVPPSPTASSRLRSPRDQLRAEENLLPDDMENFTGGEALLTGGRGAGPGRHVQLFRELQIKWQCYDAYCRVCMSLGANQVLQGLSYYSICHSMVENQSPTTGFLMIACFQSATVALAVLDLVGIRTAEIFLVQLIGILPCVIAACTISVQKHETHGNLHRDERFVLSPLCFVMQGVWLELWLRLSAPEQTKFKLPLPGKFRQVLFLDVFRDSDGTNETSPDGTQELAKFQEVIRQAAHNIQTVQSGLRRWMATPQDLLSIDQVGELSHLLERHRTACENIETKLNRASEGGDEVEHMNYEPFLRPWRNLPAPARRAESFAGCLVGPFTSRDGTTFHWDIEGEQRLDKDTPVSVCPGAFVLELSLVQSLVRDVERSDEAIEVALNDLDKARLMEGDGVQPAPGSFLVASIAESVRSTKGVFPNLRNLLARSTPRRNIGVNTRTRLKMKFEATMALVVGGNSKNWVPERLPWNVVSSISRILQVAWCGAGLTFLLKAMGRNNLDTQLDNIDLCASPWLSFELLERPWPHGDLFNPLGLFGDEMWPDELLVSSPFGVYGALNMDRQRQPLVELQRAVFRMPMVVLCDQEVAIGPRFARNCSTVSLDDDGASLSISLLPDGVSAAAPVQRVTVRRPAWRQLSGNVVKCSDVVALISEAAPAPAVRNCALFVGLSDGSFLITAFPLGGSLDFAVRPSAEIPLSHSQVQKGVLAMHVSSQLRLWVLFSGGGLDVYDLTRYRRLASWKLDWSMLVRPDFRPAALYDGGNRGLFIAGRSKIAGPILLRSSLPFAPLVNSGGYLFDVGGTETVK